MIIYNNLNAGSYSISITDASGCSYSGNPISVTITQPTVALTSSISSTMVSCFSGSNGSATVTVSGGTPGYSYSWSSGGTNATEVV